MLKEPIWRLLFGTLFGATGGVSMTMTIFPYAVHWFSNASFNFMDLLSVIFPVVILWTIGGGIAGWWASYTIGGLSLGSCGVLSGVVLALYSNPQLIVVGVLSGLLYGAIGGIIIGYAFSSLKHEGQDT
jgi:hypothetical protein